MSAIPLAFSFVLAIAAQAGAGDEIIEPPRKKQAGDEPSLWERDSLTGDWGGTRMQLGEQGFETEVVYAGEVFSNVAGGVERGTRYEALVTLALDVDLQKVMRWAGAEFHASGFWIEGEGLNKKHIPDALTAVSNMDARDEIRLFEAWIQQSVLDGTVSLRMGLLAADEEFMVSEYALLFFNSTFGPPSGPTVSMPTPIYPVASVGARLRIEPVEGAFVQAAVYDGDPGSEEFNDTGVRIRLKDIDGTFTMVETGYHHPGALPGVVKVGAMYHSGEFLHFKTGGEKRRNYGFYAMAEQVVFQESVAEGEAEQGLGAFFRVTGGPEDRSFVPVYWDAGLHYSGLIPGRDEDVAGVAVAYLGVSDDFADTQPVPSGWHAEIVVEFTYQIVVTPWLTVQPDVQVLVDPGGSEENDDALALGFRWEVVF